jgi:transcriptional regulator with XRE-family HTH domain
MVRSIQQLVDRCQQKVEGKMKTLFSDRVRELRGELSQAEASGRAGVSSAVWSSYECGIREPPITTICRMCEVFGCSADWLLGRMDSREGVSVDVCPGCSSKDQTIRSLSESLRLIAGDLKKKNLEPDVSQKSSARVRRGA